MRQPPGALEDFCRLEWPRLVGALTLYTGDPHLAEDVAQEALARAASRWDRVSQLDAPGAWTYRVALNLARSHFRRLRVAHRPRAAEASSAPVTDADPAVAIAVRAAVSALAERQRRALVLRYWFDLSVDEPVAPGARRAAVFASGDAQHWIRTADLGADVDPGGSSLTSWHGALWATTYAGGSEAASTVWRSTDGVTWAPDIWSAPSHTTFDTLTPVGPYLVATGFQPDSRPGGWVSSDGATWIPMPDLAIPPGGRLNLAAAVDDTLVALSTSELRDTYRWKAPSR